MFLIYSVDQCDGLFIIGWSGRGRKGAGMRHNRLRAAIYLGQTAGELGEVLCGPQKPVAYHNLSKRIQKKIPKVH